MQSFCELFENVSALLMIFKQAFSEESQLSDLLNLFNSAKIMSASTNERHLYRKYYIVFQYVMHAHLR